MDRKLVAWARAVKSRRRHLPPIRPLWLFSDLASMPDLPCVLRGLPRGLCGLVFRHDALPDRGRLAREVWRLCRTLGIPMVTAGARTGVTTTGVHRRSGKASPAHAAQAGRKPGPLARLSPATFATASAHTTADLVRARRAGTTLAFLSPAFPSASHPGAPALGHIRWAKLQPTRAGLLVAALGGIDGTTIRRLPRDTPAIGAISALLPQEALSSRERVG